jgi:hypothetical protein
VVADHFSVIGFKANSTEALSALVTNLLEKGGEKQPCAAGYYHRLRSAVGPELWVHMQKTAEADSDPYMAVGITPFFEGEGRAPIRVRAMRQRPDDNLFEGAFYVELGPTIALIDVVDFARFAGKPVPFMAMAQIVAFPHALRIFESVAAFQAKQASETIKIAPRSFLASGLFAGGNGSGDVVFLDPEAEDFSAPARAFLTGEVQKTERRRNPETGQEFTWALIGTAGGTFDLVADDAVLPCSLRPGMIVEGEFWLCGRVVEAFGAA